MQLDRVVRFGGGYVGAIESHRRGIVRRLGIPTPARLGRLVVGDELGFDVGSENVRVIDLDRGCRGGRFFERLRDD